MRRTLENVGRPRRVFITVMFAVLLGWPTATEAGTCTISASGVAFGSYDVFNGTAVQSTGSVTYNCDDGLLGLFPVASVTITLSRGQSSTFTPRVMNKAAETLSYNLYRDAARTQVWGDGSGGTSTYFTNNVQHNTNITLTIYGNLPASQDVSAGAYSDTITATIIW